MKKELQNQLSKKLLAYSSAAGAIMAVGQTANAQIVYTDVDPDETVVGASYNLDLNNDGTTDFILTQGSFYTGWSTVRILPQGGAGFISTQYPPASGWGTYTFAQALSTDDPINSGATFNSSSANSTMSLGFFGSIGAGPFLGQSEKFLGLRFTLDGGSTYHYGWARVSMDASGAAVTIHDYAYESTADTEILAGAGATPPPTNYEVTFGVYDGEGEVTAAVSGTPISSGDMVAEGDTVWFYANPADNYLTNDWYLNGSSTTITSDTVYYADLDMDIDLQAEFILDDEGINELTSAELNVYPNPSTGLFNIDIKGTYEVSIVSITGQIVYSNTFTNNAVLNLSEQPAGIYFLRLKTDNKVINKRIIIE